MMTEKSSITIFGEGGSRSGKTTLFKAVEGKDVAVIYKDWPPNLVDPPMGFFLERDEDKLQRAKIAPQRLKIVDRGYLSTLAFYSVLEEQVGISAQSVYRWFETEMGNKLYQPDCYIFVDVPPNVTRERHRTRGGLVYDNNMWVRFPERISYWYDQLLARFEPTTPIYKINGDRDPGVVLAEFRNLISEITPSS